MGGGGKLRVKIDVFRIVLCMDMACRRGWCRIGFGNVWGFIIYRA